MLPCTVPGAPEAVQEARASLSNPIRAGWGSGDIQKGEVQLGLVQVSQRAGRVPGARLRLPSPMASAADMQIPGEPDDCDPQ